jgi:hypothetical protein
LIRPGGLATTLLLSCAVAPGCCCEPGPDRLVRIEITSDNGEPADVPLDQSLVPFPTDAFFTVFRYGSPGRGKLRTIPMLELYEDDETTRIPLERFLFNNDGGCAIAEIYEPSPDDLTIGDTYFLVHRESAAPGDLEDTGDDEGRDGQYITNFGGERALVALVIASEPTMAQGSGGSGGSGGM